MHHLLCRKIIVSTFFLLFTVIYVSAQGNFQLNLPNSDSKWLHYGFTIGVHSSSFQLKYDDQFVTNEFDTVHSIQPQGSFGFSLGFLSDFRLHDQVNFRTQVRVAFSEYKTTFFRTNANPDVQTIEATYIEIPLMLKYKSERHKNFRVYVLGGVVPGIEASGKKRKERSENKLLIAGSNIAAEFGLGMDMYFPLFKFSPEVRFSKGLINVLKEDKFGYSDGIQKLSTNVVSLYFNFSD